MTSKRVLICSYYMPQADVDSFSRRLFHFVEFLCEAGWSVTCVVKSSHGIEQYATILESLGVPVHVGFDEHVERLASQEHFDLAILGFWHVSEPLMKILRRCSPATRIIVDSGDLHFLRHARRILRDAEADEHLDSLDSQYANEMVGELNVYAAADAVFAVSRKEADFVNDFVGDPARAYAVPDCEDFTPSPVPFAKRRGMFFVGNFQHLPNVEAVEFLCKEILPQFDPASLAHHPVYIAGNAMTESVRKCCDGLPFVRVLGWVPSVIPYLERVRVSILPLLHGAGTKRKMIQALAIGTPTVSTTIGAEGFDIRDGEEVLIADDPVAFANAAARLLQDAELWERLARQGRERIVVEHGRESARQRLMASLSAVLSKPKRIAAPRSRGNGSSRMSQREYRDVTQRAHEIVCETTPARSTVIVVSKGDDALLKLGHRGAWHFPQTLGGVYAGHHPANSAEAITHLEALRSKGGDFLVFPKSAFWWLDHYADFKKHLENRYRLAVRDANSCIIYSLREPPALLPAEPQQTCWFRQEELAASRDPLPAVADNSEPFDLESHRPVVLDLDYAGRGADQDSQPWKVLVLGVYLADRDNNIEHIVQTLTKRPDCQVTQRWTAIGGVPPTQEVADVTTRNLVEKKPKFEILNELLRDENLTEFDYVLVCDDDIVLPHGFLDRFVSLQSAFDFGIAQPALTSNSFVKHPIMEQQRGTIARETRFVEIGPVVCFHRSVFTAVFPFDLTSPIGGGYESVWASRLGKSMGIIDAVPVDHSLRESVSNYSWDEANRQRETVPEMSVDDPFRVLAVASCNGINSKPQFELQRMRKSKSAPRMSVVIPTHNRATLLDCSLESLSRQSLPPSEFEVIVVTDGSTDDTAELCERWSSRLPLTCLNIERSGIAAAKNLGVFAAQGPIILFFDDDDIADENLLAEHLKTHARYPLTNVAVLGYTDWAATLEVNEVMRYVTDIGHYLFSYTHLVDGQRLDFTYFWGGRTSCKKSLLTGTGVFRQEFEFGSEDIEAGFRIAKRLVKRRLLRRKFEVDKNDEELKHQLATIGLTVIFNRQAVQHMNRAMTYDEFCRRCERQGKSQWQFSQLYKDSIVHEWCQTTDALDRWQQIRDILPAKVGRVHHIEATLEAGVDADERRALLRQLHELYRWTFDAFKTKGIVETLTAEGPATAPSSSHFVGAHNLV